MLNRYNDLCLKLHIIHPPFKILFTNAQSATHTLANMLIWNTVILEGNKFLEKEDLKKLNNSLRILSLSLSIDSRFELRSFPRLHCELSIVIIICNDIFFLSLSFRRPHTRHSSSPVRSDDEACGCRGR